MPWTQTPALKLLWLHLLLIMSLSSSMLLARTTASNEDTSLTIAVEMRFYVDPPAVRSGDTIWVLAELTVPNKVLLHWQAQDDEYEPSQISFDLPEFLQVNRIIWPPPQVVTIGGKLQVGYQERVYVLIEITEGAKNAGKGSSRSLSLNRRSALVRADLSLTNFDGKKTKLRQSQRIYLPRRLVPGDVPPPIDIVNQSLFSYARSLLPTVLSPSRFHVNWLPNQPLLTMWGREKRILIDRGLPENNTRDVMPFMDAQANTLEENELFMPNTRAIPAQHGRWYMVLVESFDPSIYDADLYKRGWIPTNKLGKSTDKDGPWAQKTIAYPKFWVQEVKLERSMNARYDRFFVSAQAKQRLRDLNPSRLYLLSQDGKEGYQINLDPPQNLLSKASPTLFTLTNRWWKMARRRFSIFL